MHFIRFRILALAALFIILLPIVGCGNSVAKDNTTTQLTQAQQAKRSAKKIRNGDEP